MQEPNITGGPGCDEIDPHLLPYKDARQRIADAIKPIAQSETVPLRDALGRVLVKDVISPLNVPGHTNSAMDGYALDASDVPASGERVFQVLGTAWAGRPFEGRINRGEAVRVMTGAVMPAGTDTVVPEEKVAGNQRHVSIGGGHKRGQNVRAAGEDISAGEVALRAGTRVFPAELGVLSSLGIEQVDVVRRVRVAFFSTGDEIRSQGESVECGAVYDSNRHTLYGMLKRLDAELVDGGVIGDDRQAINTALGEAANTADVIITSGGVSAGAADFVQDQLREHGNVGFWRVSIKPGRPMAFGFLGGRLFFGLPGNPVAVMVTFYQFVQPALRRLMGQTSQQVAPLLRATCMTRLSKKPGRTEFYRANLERDGHGELIVRRTPHQGSGILRSMSEANCLIVLTDEMDDVEPGEKVDVQPFFGLM
jgi:molybdopterin molybdotransferase